MKTTQDTPAHCAKQWRDDRKAEGWKGASFFLPPEVFDLVMDYRRLAMREYRKKHPRSKE